MYMCSQVYCGWTTPLTHNKFTCPLEPLFLTLLLPCICPCKPKKRKHKVGLGMRLTMHSPNKESCSIMPLSVQSPTAVIQQSLLLSWPWPWSSTNFYFVVSSGGLPGNQYLASLPNLAAGTFWCMPTNKTTSHGIKLLHAQAMQRDHLGTSILSDTFANISTAFANSLHWVATFVRPHTGWSWTASSKFPYICKELVHFSSSQLVCYEPANCTTVRTPLDKSLLGGLDSKLFLLLTTRFWSSQHLSRSNSSVWPTRGYWIPFSSTVCTV